MTSGRSGKPGAPASGRSRRGKGGLSDDESELWSYVTQSIAPLQSPGRMPDLPDGMELQGGPEGWALVPEPPRAAAPHRAGNGRRHAAMPTPVASPAPPATTRAPEPAGIDRRKGRRIANGRIEIEARIDLHGMVQSAAHQRLDHFIRSSCAQGLRTVLVITGKGLPLGDKAVARRSQDDGDMFSERERGVLRRNVPRWLAEPPLRNLIVSFGPASVRHGGDGALYVVLRGPR